MKTKKWTMALCGAALATACFGGVAAIGANAEESATTLSTASFEVVATSVRYSDPDGIRFKSSISATEFDALKAADENLTVGTLCLPTDLLGSETLTVETTDVLNIAIDSQKIKAVKDGEGNVTSYELQAYVYDIPVEGYNTEITAVSYIKCADKYYYSTAMSKSLAYTAQQAYVYEGKEAATKYFDDISVEYKVEYYQQNLDGSYPETAIETETFTEKINANASITKTFENFELMDVDAADTLVWANGSTVIKAYFARPIKAVAYNSDDETAAKVAYRNNGAQAYVELKSHKNTSGTNGSCDINNYANYVGLSDEYKLGENFMRFEFKGANPIGEVIFGIQNDFSSNLNTVKGSGLTLNSAKTGAQARMLLPLSGASTSNITGSEGKNISTFDGGWAGVNINYNYFSKNAAKDFVMIVGTQVNPSNKTRCCLYVYLYEKTEEGLTLLEQIETSSVTNMHFAKNGKIMVVSECNGENGSKFTMWRPTTLEKAMEQLKADYPTINGDYTQTYTITFMKNKDTVATTYTVNYLQTIAALKETAKVDNKVIFTEEEQSNFEGWTDAGGNDVTIATNVLVKADATYYAKYKKATTEESTEGTEKTEESAE